MNRMSPTPPSPQWDYVLEVYARPGVAHACLKLQADFGVDVVVMLHAMYVFAVHGVRLDASTLAAADQKVRGWRGQVTVPLRLLRTALKSGFDDFPPEAVDAARQKIKLAELEAEAAAFAALATFNIGERVEGDDLGTAQTLLQSVIAMYAPADSEVQWREGLMKATTQTLCAACLSVASLRGDSK